MGRSTGRSPRRHPIIPRAVAVRREALAERRCHAAAVPLLELVDETYVSADRGRAWPWSCTTRSRWAEWWPGLDAHAVHGPRRPRDPLVGGRAGLDRERRAVARGGRRRGPRPPLPAARPGRRLPPVVATRDVARERDRRARDVEACRRSRSRTRSRATGVRAPEFTRTGQGTAPACRRWGGDGCPRHDALPAVRRPRAPRPALVHPLPCRPAPCAGAGAGGAPGRPDRSPLTLGALTSGVRGRAAVQTR